MQKKGQVYFFFNQVDAKKDNMLRLQRFKLRTPHLNRSDIKQTFNSFHFTCVKQFSSHKLYKNNMFHSVKQIVNNKYYIYIQF